MAGKQEAFIKTWTGQWGLAPLNIFAALNRNPLRVDKVIPVFQPVYIDEVEITNSGLHRNDS